MQKRLRLFIQLIWRWPLYQWFFRKKIAYFRWERLYSVFKKDFLSYKGATFSQKMWAYKRGFASDKIARYNLNNENYKNYISEIQFYSREMYKNQRLYYWFDDKLTTWFILQPFVEFLPRHYYSIENGVIRSICTQEQDLDMSVEGIITLLKKEGALAFKSSKGQHGKGFLKAEYHTNQFFINGRNTCEESVSSMISGLNGYLITEYINPTKYFQSIYNISPGVVRVVTMYDEQEGASITASHIRFGSSQNSPYTTDVEGNVYCGIKLDNGVLFSPYILVGTELQKCSVHPDTGTKMEGKIKNWGLIKKEILKISNYLSNTPYLVYDIVPTLDSFKILEINSHGKPFKMQVHYPFWLNKHARKLFKEICPKS